jgi:hypothetical protein
MDRPDLRAFIRHPADVPLEVRAGPVATPAELHATNVSLGGLCFLSRDALTVGGEVRIRIPTVSPPFEADARVVWCRPHGDGSWEVGARFLTSGDAFRARMVEQVCHIEEYRSRVRESEGRALSGSEAAREWIARYAGDFPGPRTA